MSDFGLTIKVTEGNNDGPPVEGAEVSGTLVPATTDAQGNAVLETVRITIKAPGYVSYVDQPYHRPSLQGPVAVSLQRA